MIACARSSRPLPWENGRRSGPARTLQELPRHAVARLRRVAAHENTRIVQLFGIEEHHRPRRCVGGFHRHADRARSACRRRRLSRPATCSNRSGSWGNTPGCHGRPGSPGSAGVPLDLPTTQARRRRTPRLLIDPANQFAVGAGDIGLGPEGSVAQKLGDQWVQLAGSGSRRLESCHRATIGAGLGREVGDPAAPSTRATGRRPGRPAGLAASRMRRQRATICGRRSSGARDRKKIAVSSGSGGIVAALTR